MKNTLLIILLACSVCRLYGVVDSDSALIHFRQSRTLIDTAYMNNGENLSRMISNLERASSRKSPRIFSSVKVIGAASPEGSLEINRRLSENRAERIFTFFAGKTPMPDSIVSFTFVGRDWNGLLRMVREDPDVPSRERVVALLEEIVEKVAEEGDTEENLRKIRALDGGVPYRYMYHLLFPTLRASRLYVEYMPSEPAVADIEPLYPALDIVASPEGSLVVPDREIASSRPCWPFYMDLKTNLLYDALALPTVGIEFYMGKGWSVTADWTYGWWDTDSRHRYWRAYGGNIGFRKWFGKASAEKPLTGHHIGIYGGVITYDFELGGTGYMGGRPGHTLWDRCNYMGGIEYGYSLPVARRLNIDFTIGVGYLGGKVVKYVPRRNTYVWESTKTLRWFGPTKAEISLVWLIGCDNFNRKKGGKS